MQFHNQTFTYYKIPEAETFLQNVLSEVAELFQASFTKDETAALILIGGYGRGEGGVVSKDGVYRPHNNLDLLYIHNGSIDAKRIDEVNRALQIIADQYGIGIDMSAINKKKLMTLEGLVIGYDMRFGHITLLGNSAFLKKHEPFSVYNIDPADIRQLLVNRGTLLLINRMLLDKETLSMDEKKLIVKHAVKAIIGYGDALLYFHNQYHWSYAQKLSNMLELDGIDKDIKALYSEAILFRFKPNYEKFLQMDLKACNNKLLERLSSIHLTCEQINLSEEDLQWDSYFKTALEKRSYPQQNLRQKVKSLLHGIADRAVLKKLDSLTQITSFLQLGSRAKLALLFPYIANESYPQHYRKLFQAALRSDEPTEEDFLRGFLNLWSQHGDTNFKNVLRTYNITLEK